VLRKIEILKIKKRRERGKRERTPSLCVAGPRHTVHVYLCLIPASGKKGRMGKAWSGLLLYTTLLSGQFGFFVA